MAQVILWENSDFTGKSLTLESDVADLTQFSFNDILTSVQVNSGTWTLYSNANFGGANVTVSLFGGPESNGNYPNSLSIGGRNDYFSSIQLNDERPEE